MATTKPTLGSTALEAWRNWRVLPCFGQALGVGEFCWQPNQAKPAGQKLHRVINELATRPATESEEDEVWDCMLKGALRILPPSLPCQIRDESICIPERECETSPSATELIH